MVECAKCKRKIGFLEEKFSYTDKEGKPVKYCKECDKAYLENEEKEKKKTLNKIPQNVLKSFFKNFAGFGAKARNIPGYGGNFASFDIFLKSKTNHPELWEALQDNSLTRCINIINHSKELISNTIELYDEQSEAYQESAGLFFLYGTLTYDLSLIPDLQEKLKKLGINMTLLELVEVLADYESKHSKMSSEGQK